MSDPRAAVERIWYGRGRRARAVRLGLAPLEQLYRVAAGGRSILYACGLLRTHAVPIPAVSVGNLTVGGTGKTPVAAWLAGELRARGATPAIVLRGYGADEPKVHAVLNPGARVIVNPDRVAGVIEAAAEGADVAVLDDAFQHRRVARAADVVLVSVDRWPARVRLLPAGPFREPLRALRRASLVLVTRKAATAAAAALVERAVRDVVPDVAIARARIAQDSLVGVRDGHRSELHTLRGRPVLAICGVGDPDAFEAQLAAAGGEVELHAFPDHHPYSEADVDALARAALRVTARGGVTVCTLKDAVKLAGRWPEDGAALSYVSQQVILDAGRDALDRLLESVLHARRSAGPAAG